MKIQVEKLPQEKKTNHHMGISHKILSENTYNLSSGTFFITTGYLRLRGIRAPHTCLGYYSRQGFAKILRHIKSIV